MRGSDYLILWPWLDGDGTHRRTSYLDTRWLDDTQHDKFLMLLTGDISHQKILHSEQNAAGGIRVSVDDDGSSTPENFTVQENPLPELIKFLPMFGDAPDDPVEFNATMDKIHRGEGVMGMRTISFRDHRRLVRRKDGQWVWLMNNLSTVPAEIS
jgi:hypothetical protein